MLQCLQWSEQRRLLEGRMTSRTKAAMWHGAIQLGSALLLAGVLALATTALVAAASDPPPLASPTPGVSIYDLTGKLSANDRQDLQTRANRLIQAGAYPVVYLQPFGADRTVTRTQANQVVTSWNLPSNNVIIFVNLDPAGQHNAVVLLAGDKYHATGVLDDAHEQSIVDAQMLPAFRRGDYHGGLAAGLDAVYERITTSGETTTNSTGPLDPRPLLSFLLVVGLLIWGGIVAVRARRPLYAGYPGAGTGTMPQDELPPAFVGALIHGHAGDQEVRATILQMSTEGALDIEPVDDRSVQIRLHDQALLRQTWELTTWESLSGVADPQRIVSAPALERAAKEWGGIADIIDAELREQGYRAPATASATPSLAARLSREHIALGAGGALMLLSLILIALPGLREIWFLLFALGVGGVTWGIGQIARTAYVHAQAKALPADLTPLGAQACAAWRDYSTRVRQRRIAPVDPTRLTLYAPVLDDQDAILPWLITAARMGFIPSWLSEGMQQARQQHVALSPFYVYWLALLQGYVDPALIQPLADDPQQLTRDDLAQPIGGIVPAPYTAVPFLYPPGAPIFFPVFLDDPVGDQRGDWGAPSGDEGGNWGGDSGGGSGDWGGSDAGVGDIGGGGGDWGGGDAGGGDFGGGDMGGGGGDF
jgi:uncharacterized membrane protein YgcG